MPLPIVSLGLPKDAPYRHNSRGLLHWEHALNLGTPHFQKPPSNKAKDIHYDKHDKKGVDNFWDASATYWVNYPHAE